MKKIVIALAVAVLVLTAAGCSPAPLTPPTSSGTSAATDPLASYRETEVMLPSAAETAETQTAMTEAPPDPEPLSLEEAYSKVIACYRAGLQGELLTVEDAALVNAGEIERLRHRWETYPDDHTSLYAECEDLDGNGVEELIVYCEESVFSDTSTNTITELYAYDGSQAVRLLGFDDASVTSQYTLYRNGQILYWENGGYTAPGTAVICCLDDSGTALKRTTYQYDWDAQNELIFSGEDGEQIRYQELAAALADAWQFIDDNPSAELIAKAPEGEETSLISAAVKNERIRYPIIHLDGEDIDAFNQDISDWADYMASDPNLGQFAETNFAWSVNGDILSVCFLVCTDEADYSAYNFSLTDHQSLSDQAVLARLEISPEETKTRYTNAIDRYHYEAFREDYAHPESPSLLRETALAPELIIEYAGGEDSSIQDPVGRAAAIMRSAARVNAAQRTDERYFLDRDGMLCGCFRVFTLAGSGWSAALIPLPDK